MYVKNDEIDPPKKASTDRQGLVSEVGLGSSVELALVWLAAWPTSASRHGLG